MSFGVVALAISAAVFVGMLACFEIGRRLGKVSIAKYPDGEGKGTGAVEAAIFGLLGLLLAFTFSGAASRFEDRRHLVREETNAIGTAYLRIDLLPEDARPEMRQLFRRYVQTRVDMFRVPGGHQAAYAKLAEAVELQGKIWSLAVAGCERAAMPSPAAMLMLSALNEMIDITTTRALASENHPPNIIFILLAGFGLMSALLVGRTTAGTKIRNWFYVVLFAATMSLTFYIILDLEFPRMGLIRVDSADRALEDLLKSME